MYITFSCITGETVSFPPNTLSLEMKNEKFFIHNVYNYSNVWEVSKETYEVVQKQLPTAEELLARLTKG